LWTGAWEDSNWDLGWIAFIPTAKLANCTPDPRLLCTNAENCFPTKQTSQHPQNCILHHTHRVTWILEELFSIRLHHLTKQQFKWKLLWKGYRFFTYKCFDPTLAHLSLAVKGCPDRQRARKRISTICVRHQRKCVTWFYRRRWARHRKKKLSMGLRRHLHCVFFLFFYGIKLRIDINHASFEGSWVTPGAIMSRLSCSTGPGERGERLLGIALWLYSSSSFYVLTQIKGRDELLPWCIRSQNNSSVINLLSHACWKSFRWLSSIEHKRKRFE